MPNTLEQAHALMADAKRQIVEGFHSGDHVVIIQVGHEDDEFPEEYVFNTSDSACQFLDYLVNTGRTAGRANLEVEINLREVLKPDYAIQRLETEFPKSAPDTRAEKAHIGDDHA